jgi:alkylation response protein AidB-like acyl-CoA dehydrogenase
MDFERTAREQEVGGKASAVLAEHSADLEAFRTADAAGARAIVLGLDAALAGAGYDPTDPGDPGAWPEAIAVGLEVAKADTALFLSFQATRRFRALAAGRMDLPGPGTLIGGVALSEPDAGTPGTPARLSGPPWRLDGQKSYVTNGPIADFLAVFARTDDGEVVAVVEASQEGVSAGPPIPIPGLDGLAVGPLRLTGARIPPDRVSGPGDGRPARERFVADVDLTLAFACAGLMQRVLDAATAHSRTRLRGGKPIARHQEVGFKLAEMLTVTHAAELLARRAAFLAAAAEPEAATVIRCARVFCAEGAERVASAGMQIAAGEGYVSGSVFERALRDARGLAVAGTTLEISRMAVADALLERF